MTRLRQLAKRFKRELAVYRAVIADPRCPRVSRWLLGAAIAYAVSPIDLIPDFIPVLGYLDDALLLPLLVGLAIYLMPKSLIAEHRERLSQTTP